MLWAMAKLSILFFIYIFGSAPGIIDSGSLNTEPFKAWTQKHKRKSLKRKKSDGAEKLEKFFFTFALTPARKVFFKTMHKILYILLLH
jgi:hypothetical protein